MRLAVVALVALGAIVRAQAPTSISDADATRAIIEGPFPSPNTNGGDDGGMSAIGIKPSVSVVTVTRASTTVPRSAATATTKAAAAATTTSAKQDAATTVTTTTAASSASDAAAHADNKTQGKASGGYFVATVVLAVLCALQAIAIGVLAYRSDRLHKRMARLAKIYPTAPLPGAGGAHNYAELAAQVHARPAAYTYEAPRLSGDSPTSSTAAHGQPSPVVRKLSRKAPPLYLEKPEGEY